MDTTQQIIREAFQAAASDFNKSLEIMRPYRNEGEDYCEANLMEYFSHALRKHNFRPFFEFPIARGRIDGVFIRDSSLLLVEAKQLHSQTRADIEADLERLAKLGEKELKNLVVRYGLKINPKETFEIALCDCWCGDEKQNWMASDPPFHNFLSGYTRDSAELQNGHDQASYSWLLAFRESPKCESFMVNLESASRFEAVT